MNLDIVRSRLDSFNNQGAKNNAIWKPKPGKQVIRIVPYKHNLDNPFIELKFHYGINNKTYLSPDSFSRPDPIVEWTNKLKKSGNKEEWMMGRKYEPKLRTFAPVLVRGEEHLGVRFWGFGKVVYQNLIKIITDPEDGYGDITDLVNGRDIVVEFVKDTPGKSYPDTIIRPKANSTPAIDPSMKHILEKQQDVTKLFNEPSYEELKKIMREWLNPEQTAPNATSNDVVVDNDDVDVSQPETQTAPKTSVVTSPTKAASKQNEDLADAFDQLFNS